MHTKKKRYGLYPRHRKHPWYVKRQFLGLSALSLALIFTVALLSRAELRLSGHTLAAADGHELAVMDELQSFESVELVRERADLRMYLLKRDEEQFLVHAKKVDGEWTIEKVERVHNARVLKRKLRE